MMNPALYPHQAYGYGNPMAQGHLMSPAPPPSHPQSPYQPGFPPNNFQRPLPHQQQPPQQAYQSHLVQNAALARPESREQNNLGIAPQTHSQSHSSPQSQPPSTHPHGGPFGNTVATATSTKHRTPSSSSAPQPKNPTPTSPPSNNMMAQSQSTPTTNLAQQAQMQNASQVTRTIPQPTAPLSPQSAARERARVSILLDINTHLLQEVVALQTQGKAGFIQNQAQQSPSSPTSATDPSNALSNSPVDAPKPGTTKPASQEYADCMRRLQANLSYLAAIADAKKKANGAVPAGPAIMIPPPHLAEVHELYKKLNNLFPEASQSTINKAMAFASAQSAKQPATIPAQG